MVIGDLSWTNGNKKSCIFDNNEGNAISVYPSTLWLDYSVANSHFTSIRLHMAEIQSLLWVVTTNVHYSAGSLNAYVAVESSVPHIGQWSRRDWINYAGQVHI